MASRRIKKSEGNKGPHLSGLNTLADLSKAGRDFVQAVARGLGDGVRIQVRKLDESDRRQLEEENAFRHLLGALDDEGQWRPKENEAFNLFGPLAPEQKELRAATSKRVRAARSVARRLVENTPGQASPNEAGRHFRTARMMSDVLKTIPSVWHVFLFGSVARGEERADSDVDLLVLRAPGLGDAVFRDLVSKTLKPLADRMEPPLFTLRPTKDVPSPPPVQLLTILGMPKRWSDQGVVEGELFHLWGIDAPEKLPAARSDEHDQIATDTGTAVLYESYWHEGESPGWDRFRGAALLEVAWDGHVELRHVKLNTPWHWPDRKEIIVRFHGRGQRTTEWSEDVAQLAMDVVVEWVDRRMPGHLESITLSFEI